MTQKEAIVISLYTIASYPRTAEEVVVALLRGETQTVITWLELVASDDAMTTIWLIAGLSGPVWWKVRVGMWRRIAWSSRACAVPTSHPE